MTRSLRVWVLLLAVVAAGEGACPRPRQPRNRPPVAVIQLLASTASTVTYHAFSSSDPDGTIVSYVWSWGDGSPDTSGPVASHTYATADQTFTVTLTVTDDDGATGTASTGFTVPTLQSFTVSPATAVIAEGQSQQFALTIVWGDGATTSSGTWTSSDPSVATVDSTGFATPVGLGGTTITATAFELSGSSTLTVQEVESVTVSPPSAAILLAGTQQFTASVEYFGGSSGTEATWTSSDPSVAMVDSSTGLATPLALGTTTITAAVGAQSDSATLTVTELTFTPEPNYAVHVGQTLTFTMGPAQLGITATGLEDGATFDGTNFFWAPTMQQALQSDEPGAFREGRYTVTFETAGGSSVDVKIGVSQLEIVSLAIPLDLTLGVDAERTAAVEVTYSNGSTALGTVGNPLTPTWEIADPATAEIANVVPTGTLAIVKALDRGVTTLTARITSASLGALSDTSIVTVLGVSSIAIDPPLLELPIGASDELQATAILEDGSSSTGVPFVWSTSAPAVVSASASLAGRGIVMGNALGSATITASADGASGFADVTVIAATRTRAFFGLDVTLPSAGDSRFVVLDTAGAAQDHATLIGPYFMEETDSNGHNELAVSALHATTFQTVFQKVDAAGAVTVAHEIPIPQGQEPDFVTDIRLQDDGRIYVAADDGAYTFSTVSPAGQVKHKGAPTGSTIFGQGTLGLAGGDVVYTGPWDFEYTLGAAIIGTASLVGRYDQSMTASQRHVPVAVTSWLPSADAMVAPGGVLHAVDGPLKVVYRFVDLDGDGDHFNTQDSLDEFGNPVREAFDDPGERQVFANLPLTDFTLRADLGTGKLFAVRVTGVDPKRMLVLELVDLNADGDADDAGEQVVLFDAAAPSGTSIQDVDLLP